jgi:uncharacterized protein (TIGR02246 family)
MTSLTTVAPEDRAAIHDLVTEHAWTLDHGDPARLAEHYTEDGELIGLDKPLIGRDAIGTWGRWRAGLKGRTSRHVHTNVRLTVEDGVHRGVVTTLLYRHEGDGMGGTVPFLVSDYVDTYEKVDGRWLIAHRDMRRVFADPARVGGTR